MKSMVSFEKIFSYFVEIWKYNISFIIIFLDRWTPGGWSVGGLHGPIHHWSTTPARKHGRTRFSPEQSPEQLGGLQALQPSGRTIWTQGPWNLFQRIDIQIHRNDLCWPINYLHTQRNGHLMRFTSWVLDKIFCRSSKISFNCSLLTFIQYFVKSGSVKDRNLKQSEFERKLFQAVKFLILNPFLVHGLCQAAINCSKFIANPYMK